MTVRENVELALAAHAGDTWRPVGRLDGPRRAAADALLERVGMTQLADQGCGTLAYGDAKRVELAIALAGAPKLLLMDEPTAGMAPRSRQRLMGLAAELARRDGIAVLFTEHDMDVVFATADRVLVLDRGELIAAGSPAAIRADPRVRAVYLGEDTDEAVRRSTRRDQPLGESSARWAGRPAARERDGPGRQPGLEPSRHEIGRHADVDCRRDAGHDQRHAAGEEPAKTYGAKRLGSIGSVRRR